MLTQTLHHQKREPISTFSCFHIIIPMISFLAFPSSHDLLIIFPFPFCFPILASIFAGLLSIPNFNLGLGSCEAQLASQLATGAAFSSTAGWQTGTPQWSLCAWRQPGGELGIWGQYKGIYGNIRSYNNGNGKSAYKYWKGMGRNESWQCRLRTCLFVCSLGCVPSTAKTIKNDQKRCVLSIQRNIIATIQLRVAGGFTFANITQSPSGTIRQAFMRVLPSYPLALEIAIRHLQPKWCRQPAKWPMGYAL